MDFETAFKRLKSGDSIKYDGWSAGAYVFIDENNLLINQNNTLGAMHLTTDLLNGEWSVVTDFREGIYKSDEDYIYIKYEQNWYIWQPEYNDWTNINPEEIGKTLVFNDIIVRLTTLKTGEYNPCDCIVFKNDVISCEKITSIA